MKGLTLKFLFNMNVNLTFSYCQLYCQW